MLEMQNFKNVACLSTLLTYEHFETSCSVNNSSISCAIPSSEIDVNKYSMHGNVCIIFKLTFY